MEYQIGDFSKISRMSIKTLRYYHEIEILNPSRIDNFTGYRYYDEKSVERSNLILVLKSYDFSLKEIKEILEKSMEDSDILNYMNIKKNEIKNKIESYMEIEKKINNFIINQEEIKMKKYTNDIDIKEIPDIIFASLRFKGKYSNTGKAFEAVAKAYGFNIYGKPFRLDHDAEFKTYDADIDAGYAVKKEKKDEKEIKTKILKGGKAVSIVHLGSYETLGTSYQKLIDFINENNIKTVSPGREIYIKGPGMFFMGNPKNYITEIQMMIEK